MKKHPLKTAFTFLLFTGFISFAVSCNSKDKKGKVKDVSMTDVSKDTMPQPPAPPHTYPVKDSAVTVVTMEKKCFENIGLKYNVRIEFELTETAISGKVISKEIDVNQQTSSDFTGSINGNSITIKFAKQAPVVGDASEWTDKPWKLVKNGSKEKLLIPFDAKNYETNKWQISEYEFEACK